MKKLVVTLTLAIAALLSFAQIPQTFSYQGVVRDAESKIVAEKPITVNVQILQGTDEGTEVYAETHEVTTNANGLMTFELGSKDAEKFAKIDWSNAPYFVKTVAEFDGKQISGITPLLAVPYALYAAKTDLSGYYSKEEVDALLAALESKIENGNENSNDNGAIKAAFSVSADKKVYFSKGNLQYQASTGTWRFAEHQYDIIGSDNSNISSSYSGWIDLFGWGTSGWNSGANAYQPYSTSTSTSDYYPGGDYTNNLTGSYANADWGIYNKISNGGNKAGQWRTLTKDEWAYLINTRTNASSKKGIATVNSVTGLVLLPDEWTLPADVTFTSGANGDFAQNTYSTEEWSKMETNGAVFLPAAGYRYGTDVGYVGSHGYYWSSSAYGSDDAYCLYFGSGGVSTYNGKYRSNGHSVRLVQDAE
ncbi:MAG: hypothetical protein J6Y55_07660 [Bacteroidales bacterium]|nr:hypothetical protein [Bacteroidales bacterium]